MVSTVLALVGVGVANAQYSTTTAISNVSSLTNDVGSGISGVIPTILVILAGLLLLGWGIRAFRKHITGKKF